MSRPKPNIINSTQVTDRLKIEVLASANSYLILYKGQPINLRQTFWTVRGEIVKYMRTSYASRASAENLRDKLNSYFFTNDFEVKDIF